MRITVKMNNAERKKKENQVKEYKRKSIDLQYLFYVQKNAFSISTIF